MQASSCDDALRGRRLLERTSSCLNIPEQDFKLSALDLRPTIVDSIIQAQYEYLEMTGKRGFMEVSKEIPEKILEVAAARACFELLRGSGMHVLQEFSFSGFHKTLIEKHQDGRAKKFKGDRRRVDIAIRDDDGKIRNIVEIKRRMSTTATYHHGDFKRLREIKNYFHERAGHQINAIFAYPLICSRFSGWSQSEELEQHEDEAKEIFGNAFKITIGHQWIKQPEEEFYFRFGAVSGFVD